MRFITFILGLYMLLLPCVPCTDQDECGKPETASLSQRAGHAGHENEEEACAPFCNCACCVHVVGSNILMPKIAAVKPLPGKKFPSHYNSISLPSDFFGNIWQPPKCS